MYVYACKIHTNMHSIDASRDAVIGSKHQSPQWTLVTLPDLNIYIWKRGTGTGMSYLSSLNQPNSRARIKEEGTLITVRI